MIEILAPAGGKEALLAAVKAGADAVYLGVGKFNARRNADNFSKEDLAQTVSFCHQNGVKVHLTLNTLILEEEIKDAFDMAAFAAECGVDALIVQDVGIAALIKKYIPDLPIHASTQMSIHNACGAVMAYEMGFCRVVTARELNKEEIKNITESVPQIETEIFVHGALCMSVSGQCYLSALLGSRSGNRGLCAQACRLDFKCGKRDYALSLKDLSLVDYLKDISVNSVKIEGRMKRPEYVAAAVYNCKKAVSGESVSEEEKALLRAAFSRSGFTDNYFTGAKAPDMFGHRTKADTVDTNDAYGKINALIRHEYKRLPVDMHFSAKTGENTLLTVTDCHNGYSVTVTGDVTEKANNRPTERERIEENLKKTGNTPFFVNNIDIAVSADAAIPMSKINELRRNALQRLADNRAKITAYEVKTPDFSPCGREEVLRKPDFHYRFSSFEQIPFEEIKDEAAVILPLHEIIKHREELTGKNIIAELPRLIFDENQVLKDIRESGIKEAVCGNIGAVKLAKKAGIIPHGDFGLNVTNSHSLSYFKNEGLKSQVISFELTFNQISKIAQSSAGIIAYGRLPLMLTRACINRGGLCVKCSNEHGFFKLTDRKNEVFPVYCGGGYNEVLNCRKLYLADRLGEIPNLGFLKLYFTDESRDEAKKIINDYKNGNVPAMPFTRGLYYRGVK